MDNSNEFILKLSALLDQKKSKRMLNSNIKELEKVISKIKLVATFAKGNTKTELNQAIKQMEGQLRQVKIQAKFDSRQLSREVNRVLRNVSTSDIRLNINSNSDRLNAQVRRTISQARDYIDRHPLNLNIGLKKEKLSNQLTSFLNKNTKINESAYWLKEANRIRTVIDSISNRSTLRDARDEFNAFTSGVRATGYAAVSTSDKIKGMLGNVLKIGNYFGAAFVIVNKFRASLNNLKEMDTIYTEISKTTDLGIRKLDELAERSYSIASKYGVFAKNFSTSLQEMSRAGFGDGKAEPLAELATLAQSAGALTSELANEYLIASSAAYGYQGNVEKLNALLDSQNQVTNRNAVSMTELADATKVAANQLANSNISENQMTALLGTGIATTKESGQVVGRAVKAIVMNLQQVKNTDEGLETTDEDLGKVESRLTSLGIKMKEVIDGTTRLRNPITILKELAETYNALPKDSVERANIISDIGGKYRGNVLSSILSNWETYSKMLGDYENADGSALREAEKSANSLQGKLAQLQNTWDNFVSSVTSKNTIKGGISFLDGIINSFGKLVDAIGAIPVVLTAVNTAFVALNKNKGITQIFNHGKLDVQGNFMGIDITAIKKQKAHFADASIAIRDWNSELSNGVTDLDSFRNETVKNNTQLKDYLKTCSSEAPGSLDGYKQHLRAAGISTDALRIKTILLNSAITMGVSLAIQGIISGIVGLANASDKIRESAKEIGSSFKDTKSDIEEYKTKISELQSVINDSSSSISDVTEARKNLMSIQDELIEKYGSEVDTIHIVTDAINDQAGALDELSKKKYIESKNEFNDAGFLENISNNFSGYSSNMDRMISEMEGSFTLNLMNAANRNGEEYQKFAKIISQYGVLGTGHEAAGGNGIEAFTMRLDGGLENIYEKLLKIQDAASNYDFGSDDFNKYLTNKINETKETLDDYADLYDNYVLYDKILSDSGNAKGYDESFKKLVDAHKKYQQQAVSEDENVIRQAQENYSKLFTEAIENIDDDSVIEYFRNMYPELREIVGSWQFNLDFSNNIDNIKNNVKEATEKLKKDGYTVESLVDFNQETATQEQIENYSILEAAATKYHMTVENLLPLLEEMGLVQSESYKQLVSKFGEDNVKTLNDEDLEIAYTIKASGDMTFEQLKNEIEEMKKQSTEATDVTLSFKEAWKAIGTSGDEKADKAANEAKEKLLELAEAGKLTEEAFSKSSIAENFLKDTKLSAEEATQKINELISSADQLSSMKTGISSISNILGEKKENQSSKKTRNKGIGADTLAGMPDDIKAQTKEYEHFVEVLGDGSSQMDECKEAANKLATAYVNSNNFLSNLTKENKDYYKSVLKEMGVENAAEVVKAALNKQKVNAKIATFDMKNATEQEISTLGSYVKSLDDSSKALAYYTLQQQIANNNALDTSDSVKNLMKLAEQCGITGEAIEVLKSLISDMQLMESGQISTSGLEVDTRHAGEAQNHLEDEIAGAKNRLNKIIEKGVKVGTSAKITPKSSSGSKGKSKKDKSDKSKSKQQFDWISRALDRLSSKLDLVKAKYDNLFTVKKIKNSDSLLKQQNKNLDKQYKLLQKTEKYQKRAQKKYTKKANSVRISKNKKENASLKKAVREGRIKGRMKQLIATYGEKKAEKIQKYQDWYDKAQEQKKNRITTQTAKRENRIEKYQNIVDNADEKRSLAQAGKENATTAKDKNAFIEKEKESIETSYEYQIRIARLKKDSLEADRLIAEKAKEIRDLTIEHHQNLADEHQSILDQYNAEKELATKASEKNGLIESEKAKTQELYTEKIAIAGLEGNISEQKQLQAELDKQLRDFSVEQHQNLADEYQAELDKSSAEKENLYTAGEKNTVVDREKTLTSQLYAEKIAIAHIEGRISEELQLQEELTRQMVVLEKEKFDNISHYYENLMRLENNAYTDLKNASEELETRGLIVSGKLYNSQIAINNSKKKMYEDELLSLNNQLHSIKEGTDEWYESMDAIQSCENGIAEITKDTLALAEASRKVSFTLSDKILSRFDLISSEYDLFVKFMSDHKLTTDETGNFTEEGTATLGAYYTQLLLAEKETVTFKQSLTDMYDKLQRGEEGYTDQKAWDEYYEHMEKSFQLEEKYYDIRQNMIGLMKEKYNTELDFLQDIINKRKELLQAEKDEYDYRNTIEEKTKNIGVLAKQIQALNGDDSEAARSRVQQLKVNLDEAQKDLQDTEYDKWLSDQQTMLDNLYNEYHDFIDDKLNDTDALFNEAVTYLKDINVGAEVSEVLKSYGETYDHTYTPYFENINTALGKEGDIVKAITNTSDLISEHFNKQAVTTQEAGDVIKLISEIGQVDYDGDGRKRLVAAEQAYNSLSQEARTIVDTTSVNGLTTLQQKQSEWLGLSEARKQEEERVKQQQEAERVSQQEAFRQAARDKLTDYIKRTYGANGREYACNIDNASPSDIGIAEAINRNGLRRVDGWNSPTSSAISQIVSWINSEGTGVNIPATADGLWMYMQNIGYSNGGIAETLQKVPGKNGDDGWVTVKKGEGIFTPEQTQQFIKLVSNVDTLNPALDAVKSLSKSEYEPVPNRITNQSVGEVNIEMNLPNVTNYEEFRRRMQSDPKIEKMFKSMVWDKGDFSKYRIRM